MKKLTYKISLGGITAAICMFSMFFTGVMPLLAFVIPLFCGILLGVVAVEISPQWGFVTYAVVAILSAFLTPDKDAVVIFLMFFGYYPILRFALEKIRIKSLKWLLKILVFNVSIVISYLIMINITGTVDLVEEFGFLRQYMLPVLFVFGNLVFVLYDYTVSVMVLSYLRWFRPTFLNKKK